MKKICLLIASCAISLGAYAQQALGEFRPTVSPQINPDHTVTFRLRAPGATSVGVIGDCLPHADAPVVFVQMTLDADSIWTYTTPDPLDSELYFYNFIVDGLKINDPSNVYRLRDISSIFDFFIVPGTPGDVYSVNDVPHGTLAKVWYDSPTFNHPRRMTIYTPPGYEQNADRRYPVFYLLHGAGGDENAWSELGRASQILDNMIASGQAEPMIVVMTNGNSSQVAAPGESADGMAQPGIANSFDKAGFFEMHFPEVVEFVDNNYRTIADKQHRAIAGLSMGGFHSMQISKEYPDMFDFVGLFSAATTSRGRWESPVYDNLEHKLAVQFARNPNLYYIAIGNQDFLYDENVAFRQFLDEHAYPYEYVESADGHIWKNWRYYLTDFLPKLFR